MTNAGRILIIPKGEWNAETEYEMLDLVNYGGTSWLAKGSSQNVEPSDTHDMYWQKIISTGYNIKTEVFVVQCEEGVTEYVHSLGEDVTANGDYHFIDRLGNIENHNNFPTMTLHQSSEDLGYITSDRKSKVEVWRTIFYR